MTVKIVTDSTCDLPEELRRALDITVVPVYINYQGRTYRDGIDMGPDELYHKISESNVPLTTSQPPPSSFVGVYKRLLNEADNILSIHVTSKLSGIYNSALQAKEIISGKTV